MFHLPFKRKKKSAVQTAKRVWFKKESLGTVNPRYDKCGITFILHVGHKPVVNFIDAHVLSGRSAVSAAVRVAIRAHHV